MIIYEDSPHIHFDSKHSITMIDTVKSESDLGPLNSRAVSTTLSDLNDDKINGHTKFPPAVYVGYSSP